MQVSLSISRPNINIRRNQPPVFQGKSRELEKVLDSVINKPQINESEKNLLIKKIKAALQDILIDRRFIEEGSHNKIYKITKKYAARIPIGEKINAENIGDDLEWGENKFKALRNYFGEAIVKLGKFQILRNVSPQTPAGIPEHLAKKYSDGRKKGYYLNKYLPKFACVSQHSYNVLARDLAKLNEMKFGPRLFGLFDSLNPNNIVLHEGNLMLVDEIYTLCDRSYSNTTAKLLKVLINMATKDMESPEDSSKLKYVRKIFKKTVLAGVYSDLVHANSKEDYKNWEIALKKCHIDIEASDLIETLENFSRAERNPYRRMRLADDYLSKLTKLNHANI